MDMSSGRMFFYHGGKLSLCALAPVLSYSFWGNKIKEKRGLQKHAFDLNTATTELPISMVLKNKDTSLKLWVIK